MTFLLALIGGVAGLVTGFIVAAAIAFGVAGATGMPDFEGGRAMVSMFMFGPVGGIVGLFAGVWLVLRLRGQQSIGKLLGYGGLVAASIIAIGGVAIGVLQMTGDILRPNQAALQLEFELRLPPHTALPPRHDAVKVALNTDRNTMPAKLVESMTRQEGDRVVIRGVVDLYFRTSNRLLVLNLPGEPDRIFRLALPARPRISESYSAWTRVDFVAGTADAPPHKASPDDAFDVRYRVIDPTVPR